MSTVHKITYSATNTAMTITLANLSNSAYRSSSYVDNSSNVYIDAMVRVKVGIGTTTSSDQAVYVYGYGSEDGVLFDSLSSGTDATIITSGSNINLLKVISCKDNPFTSTDLTCHIGSMAQGFGGNLPKYWGVVIGNFSGGSLVNTSANHAVTYTGIYYTST
jgi:hypothetical protein